MKKVSYKTPPAPWSISPQNEICTPPGLSSAKFNNKNI